MSNHSVYLAGPMTGMKVSDSRDGWRARTSGILEPLGIECMSPLRGWASMPDNHIMKARGEDEAGVKLVEGKLHFDRDVFDIRRSSAIYVNTAGATQVSLGTVSEMAMAYILGKPIIAVLDPWHVHLFSEQECSVICDTEEQALECLMSILNVR